MTEVSGILDNVTTDEQYIFDHYASNFSKFLQQVKKLSYFLQVSNFISPVFSRPCPHVGVFC